MSHVSSLLQPKTTKFFSKGRGTGWGGQGEGGGGQGGGVIVMRER